MKIENNEMGKKIKNLRDSYKLSQKRFGKKIGVSDKLISAYETGKCTPSIKVLNKIANTYKTSFSTSNRLRDEQINHKISNLQSLVKELNVLINDKLSF